MATQFKSKQMWLELEGGFDFKIPPSCFLSEIPCIFNPYSISFFFLPIESRNCCRNATAFEGNLALELPVFFAKLFIYRNKAPLFSVSLHSY